MKSPIPYLAVLFVAVGIGAAQDQPQPAKATPSGVPTIRTTTQEVVLDMVFRDKKGRSIHDIRPEEVHIYEDGTEEKLNSFRMVDGKTAQVLTGVAPGAQAAPMPLDPMREIRLVTLVFQNIGSPDDKRFFQQAVKDMLAMAPEQNLYFSILTIDQKLHLLQQFTQDRQALLKTANKSMMWSFTQFLNQSAEVKQELQQVTSANNSQVQGSGNAAPTAAQIGGMVDYKLAKMQQDMIQSGEAVDREFDVRATMSGLMSLVRAQSTLPGRKVVLYFNPWFVVSDSVMEQYKNLKSLANRANVTFYTVDTKGLVSYNQSAGGLSALQDMGNNARDASTPGASREVRIDQVRAGETAENAARSNPLEWLKDLAKETGGAAIGESNDWKAPLRVAMEEVRTYFEASYTPQIATYDGRFRKIAVKVDRADVQVHTRGGYYALPVLGGGQQLYSYEVPLLNAILSNPAPSDVVFRAAASRFNERDAKVEYMMTVEVPMQGLVFVPHPEKKTATVDASVVVVLRDEHGEIVDKLSKDLGVQVDLEKVEGYKAGNMVQTFHTSLKPGSYTMETAVMDRQGNKVGVKKSAFQVPEQSNKLSISDIVVVRRNDPLKDNQIQDAFYYEGGKITPTLTGTLKGGPGNVLPFYFAIYVDPGVKEAAKLTMSFYMGGTFLGSAEAPLPPPQKDGRIPYIANLPADKFLPGDYEIKVGVVQGDETAEGKIAFKVE